MENSLAVDIKVKLGWGDSSVDRELSEHVGGLEFSSQPYVKNERVIMHSNNLNAGYGRTEIRGSLGLIGHQYSSRFSEKPRFKSFKKWRE